jgi:U3 small nucleolar RNA-associated protein 18
MSETPVYGKMPPLRCLACELGLTFEKFFFFDSGLKSPIEHTHVDADDDQGASDDDQPSASDGLPSREPSAVSGSSVSLPKRPSALASTLRKSKKAPAWVDPDDAELQVSLANDNRLRKLRDAPDEDVIAGKDYELRLRRQ